MPTGTMSSLQPSTPQLAIEFTSTERIAKEWEALCGDQVIAEQEFMCYIGMGLEDSSILNLVC